MALRDIYESGFGEEAGKTTSGSICPECEGNLITEGGETCRRECGLIIDEQRIRTAVGTASSTVLMVLFFDRMARLYETRQTADDDN